MIKNRSHPCNWTYVRVQHSIMWRIRELAQCKLSTVKILYQLNTVDVCLHCFKILTHWTIVMMIMKQIIKSQSCLSFVRFQLWVSCWIFVNRKYYKLGQCYVNTPKSFTFFFTFYWANLLKTRLGMTQFYFHVNVAEIFYGMPFSICMRTEFIYFRLFLKPRNHKIYDNCTISFVVSAKWFYRVQNLKIGIFHLSHIP